MAIAPVRLSEVGDSALLLEIGPPANTLDIEINARAIAVARAIRDRDIQGVRDVVPTFRSVAVFFHPLLTDAGALAAALHECSDADVAALRGQQIDVPVAYGGDAGPDLDAVAAFAGCSAAEVIERHAARTYRVFMLGFLPGFPYMGTVDATIAAPRRSSPRTRVAAGSVGIAGLQTGIYPRDSPGGWQIIGRTPLSLFDATRTQPALFAPGDTVRFVPADPSRFVIDAAPTLTVPRTGRFITVQRPGILTTVQDVGRWGFQALGVPVSGPMDPLAHAIANLRVRNPREAAALETTLDGPELRIGQDTHVAVGGADLQARVDGVEVPMEVPIRCRAGSVLTFGGRRSGARAYVAFDGGIVVPAVLGSRATHVFSGLGGIDGRALKAGDRLPLGEKADLKVVKFAVKADLEVGPSTPAILRILPGPQVDQFDPSALDLLERQEYTISPQSDRMGYRLTGGLPLRARTTGDMISDVTFTGALQIPPSGEPILLMADRQTTGGYPQIAVVISADLPVAGQLAPGDRVRFTRCTRAEAVAALVEQEGRLLAIG